MKTAAAIALVAALIAAAFGAVFGFGERAGTGQVAAAARAKIVRGPLRITVEQNGFLAAKENVKIQPRFKGQGTITWLIEEGTSVVPGDLLIEFDKTQIESQVADLVNKLSQYEIEREAAQSNLELQASDNQASIERAELELLRAQLSLERYEQGVAPNDLRRLQLAVEKAASVLERERERFALVPALVEQGFLTRSEEEEGRLKVQEAEINLESAQRDLELFASHTSRMERTEKEASLKNAQRDLENARKKAEIHLKEKQAALSQREQQVSSTKTTLERQRTELGHFTVRAENSGVVHRGDPENQWMRDRIQIGSTLSQGWTILTIPDLSTMQILVNVHEADIDKIALDMPAVITVDARRGESFPGRITEIASVASTTSWSDESNKSFRVKIMLDPVPGALRAGVTAKAEIQVETLEDVLQAPVHAIVPEGGRHLAFVIAADGIVEREVKIGKHNAHHVEILEGLSEGEEILLYDPRREGASSSVAGERAGAANGEADGFPGDSP